MDIAKAAKQFATIGDPYVIDRVAVGQNGQQELCLIISINESSWRAGYRPPFRTYHCWPVVWKVTDRVEAL